jgi:hypothetical protein
MNGRSFASIIFSLIVVGILVAVGVGIYQAGIAQGVIDAGRFPAGASVPVAGYGYHDGGFGFLGLLFPLFFLFLIFGLIRAAFGHRRGWGHGYDYGSGDTSGRRWDREQYVAEMHRRLHETDAGSDASGSGSGNAAGSTGSTGSTGSGASGSGSGSGSASANPGSSGPR